MILTAIHHVQLAMPAGQEAAARRFYGEALGVGERQKPPHLAVRGGCWFEDDHVRIHLGVEEDFRPARKAHPAFVVDDLTEVRRRLEAAGYPAREEEPLPGHHRCYVDDPFGNRIELLEPLDETTSS
jgi:catechol 2,3-dioxygenase-like lactoylglutathione lyase family enzyme